ncbi:MAG: transcription termination/antitermination protein NusA [Nitrospiraceae bacterium]|nr:MAG: transcription termination/antitermination protein NusA [Nitrospiraceae bacterium]
MNRELIHIIEQMSKERGIPKESILSTLESALLSAVRKKYGLTPEINIKIDAESGEITMTAVKTIVEKVSDPNEEISVRDASKIETGKKTGDTVEAPISLENFGRIAAQTAKQVLFQRVREAEKEAIFEEYKDKAGQIVSGVVIRREKGSYYVALGRAEATLPIKNTLAGETLKRSETIRAYIEEVKVTPKGPVILLSRTHPNFVGELFKMEIPEIYEGLVSIKEIVREAGDRTKLTVTSKNPMIDPVGACVGMKGTRVQSIVRELRGERIDIIPWTDDPRVLIAKALSPAVVESIGINEEGKSAMVVVNDQQLSIAIGKKGQNVRLAMKLTGWDIDIISETEYNKIRKGEIESQLEELQEENELGEDGADTDDNSQTNAESQEESASEDEQQER